MKKILLSVLLMGSSLFAVSTGGERESFQAKIKVELIKEDKSMVTILDGTNFIELKTTGDQAGLADTLEAVRPENGNYIGVKFTVTAFKHKLNVTVGPDTTYYTVDTEVEWGDIWGVSTDINDYGYTTTLAPEGGYSTTVTFPKVLTLASGSDASLVWVNQYLPDSVRFETEGDVADLTWADETTKVTAILPAMPTQTIVFDVVYTQDGVPNLTNTITALLDTEGDLIGAYQMRPDSNQALNGSFLTQGTKTDSAYTFRFQNGNDIEDGDSIEGDDYYDVNVTLDCGTPSYSNLIINEVIDGAEPITPNPGYTLTESGTITCTDLNL